MRKLRISFSILLISVFILFFPTSCEKFLDTDQEIYIDEENLFNDWYEYRSAAMGLYSIQQDLVEQILILGDLRADLLTITENADPDMIEIYNYSISKENKYASPVNFYKLISASNNLIRILQLKHPEVLDRKAPANNYDRLYGEALCMRAWAYFNAVRIYGKVPFIHESLTSVEEVEGYVSSQGTYIDSIDIYYNINGYNNDTVYNNPISLTKQFYDQDLIIDYFTNELESKIKEVGVKHYLDNLDYTWEITIWSEYSKNALLGIMYLTDGDLAKAAKNFEKIIYLTSDNFRYQLDNTFANTRWKDIFTGLDRREHIFTIWFNKANLQQNDFQRMFEPRSPHQYMLKPSDIAILNYEATWDNFSLIVNSSNPSQTILDPNAKGRPGDFSRGHGASYVFMRNGVPLPNEDIQRMLNLRAEGDDYNASLIVEDVQKVVWKYSLNQGVYDEDANFTIYRAAGIHLWLAEIYSFWLFEKNGVPITSISTALSLANNGSNFNISTDRKQLGVRGRVSLGGEYDGLRLDNVNYFRDPYTNKVIGFNNLTGNLTAKQKFLEEQIIQERALELAFEGERFYDLMRVAKRRGVPDGPKFLAEIVSRKYPVAEQDRIYKLLLDEKNWYIPYFE